MTVTTERTQADGKKKAKKGGVQIIAIKTYEDKITELHKKMEKMNKDWTVERKFIKNAAIAYAINYYKNKSIELTKIFTHEGLRMIEKYTILRKALIERDN